MYRPLDLTGEPLDPPAAAQRAILWSISANGKNGCGVYEDAAGHLLGFRCEFEKGLLVARTAQTVAVDPPPADAPPAAPGIGPSIRGINDNGDMTGLYAIGRGAANERGFVLLKDMALVWIKPPQASQGLGINNRRVVAGTVSPDAVVMDGNLVPLVPKPLALNAAPGKPPAAQGINNNAEVVGSQSGGGIFMELAPGTLDPKPKVAPHWAEIPDVVHGDGTQTLYVATGISKSGTIVGFARHIRGEAELHRYGFLLPRKNGGYATENMVSLAVPDLAGTYWELTDIDADGHTIAGFHCVAPPRRAPRVSFTVYNTDGW